MLIQMDQTIDKYAQQLLDEVVPAPINMVITERASAGKGVTKVLPQLQDKWLRISAGVLLQMVLWQ